MQENYQMAPSTWLQLTDWLKENQKPLLMLVLKLTFGIHKTNILILSLSPYLLLTSAIRSGSHRVK
jgi:hypothetical protein